MYHSIWFSSSSSSISISIYLFNTRLCYETRILVFSSFVHCFFLFLLFLLGQELKKKRNRSVHLSSSTCVFISLYDICRHILIQHICHYTIYSHNRLQSDSELFVVDDCDTSFALCVYSFDSVNNNRDDADVDNVLVDIANRK
jgi:hypothetical protein